MTVSASAVSRVLGIETKFRDLREGAVMFLPQRIAVVAQGRTSVSFSLDKFQAFSAKEVGDRLGYGSPAHLAALEFFPPSGGGVGVIPVTFYPMEDAYGAVAATGSITPSGTQTKDAEYRARIGGVLSDAFTVLTTDTNAQKVDKMVAAINAVLAQPMVAADGNTVVNLTSKWAGTSANDIYVEIIGDLTLGTVFTVVQPSGGLVNPDVDDALGRIGGVWETLILNALNPGDTTALDAYMAWGEPRWEPTERKPALVFRGSRAESVSTATAVTSTRTDDRVNVQLVAPGSPNLPCVIAAAQMVEIAKMADTDPPHDYGSRRCRTLVPGSDSVQWLYAQREAAVRAGSSTIEVKSNRVCISDVVTSWAPVGEADPAYRFVVDIIKLMNCLYNLELIFASEEWDGAPMIPDDQPTTNPSAKKPKMAVTAVCNMIDALALAAILADPKTAKSKTRSVITGPKRIEVETTIQLSPNSNVKDVKMNWGFYYGNAAA